MTDFVQAEAGEAGPAVITAFRTFAASLHPLNWQRQFSKTFILGLNGS